MLSWACSIPCSSSARSRVRETVSGRKPERTLLLGVRSAHRRLGRVRPAAGAHERRRLPLRAAAHRRTDDRHRAGPFRTRRRHDRAPLLQRQFDDAATALPRPARSGGTRVERSRCTCRWRAPAREPRADPPLGRAAGASAGFRIADGTPPAHLVRQRPARPRRCATRAQSSVPDSFSRRGIAQGAMLYGRESPPGRSRYLLPALGPPTAGTR